MSVAFLTGATSLPVLASGGVFNQNFECLLVSWQPRGGDECQLVETERGEELQAVPAVLPRWDEIRFFGLTEELPLHSLLCSPLGLAAPCWEPPYFLCSGKNLTFPVTPAGSRAFFKPSDPFCFWCLLSLPVVFWFSQNWWGGFLANALKLLKVFQPSPSQRKPCLQLLCLADQKTPKPRAAQKVQRCLWPGLEFAHE